jgi:monoamine oxidase
MAAVIDAVARRLPEARMRLGHALEAVVDHGDFVELRLRFGDASYSVNARRVVLALPPRVAHASVEFFPELSNELSTALRSTPTWMATAAKAGFTYSRAFWREAGHTGNAWISHPQAMLAEIFDGCGPDEGSVRYAGSALAGFSALNVAQRDRFSRGRALLLNSQIMMLFGPQADDPALLPECHWQDWACEPQTCSPSDIAEDGQRGGGHPRYGDPVLAQPHWQGRLNFGGSETARQGGGYLEGALAAAGRLRHQLAPDTERAWRPSESANDQTALPRRQNAIEGQALQLDRYAAWAHSERSRSLTRYREFVHGALTRQMDAGVTQLAVLSAVNSLYGAALQRIEALPLGQGITDQGTARLDLAARLSEPFVNLGDELLAQALIFNRTSCALSNFEAEHRPSGAYLRTIRDELARTWRVFTAGVGDRLTAKLSGRVPV